MSEDNLTEKFVVWVDKRTRDWYDRRADERNTPLSRVLREALSRYMTQESDQQS